MEKKISNEIKGNKDCNIEIKNIIGLDDKLAKYNIFDERITNKKKLENEFLDRIGYAEKIYSRQLPLELQDYFEIKSQKVGNKMEFLTEPKRKDAYEKFPPKISFSYNPINIRGLEKFKAKSFKELTREMYEKQEGIIIENPYNFKEYLGNLENPASIFTNIDSNAKSTIYITPQPFPPAIAYNIKLFNNYFEFELDDVMLRTEKIEDGVCTLSNYEAVNDKYNIKLKTKIEDENVNFSITIQIKEKYNTDSEAIKEFIKYDVLIHDSESVLVIQIGENKDTIINTRDFGEKKFGKKEYKEIQKELNFLDKVIFVEKRKNIKFKYNENLLKDKELIYFLYNEVQEKNYTFTGDLTWTLYANEDQIDIKNLQKVYKDKIPLSIVTTMNDLDFDGVVVKLTNHKLIIKRCEISSIEKEKDNYTIIIKTNNAKVEIAKRSINEKRIE